MLRRRLDTHNELTLLEQCTLWEKDTGMKLSFVTMHRINNRLGISRKKTVSAREQDPLARLVWLTEVLKHDPKRLVFIDESGFDIAIQIVVLDNLQVHKTQARGYQGCELLLLPSYSPDSSCPLGINPIEQAFSKLKTLLRKYKARTKRALDDAIAAALKAVNLQDVIGWFSYSA